jgi:glycosyltransferase involved in cell wall biosynthesis
MGNTNKTNKPKLLAWCDFLVPTGFGTVSKNLLDNMHTFYDTDILAINYQGDRKYDTKKYFLYSVNQQDMLGIKRMPTIVDRTDYDMIFLFQDIFHISDIINDLHKQVKGKSKIVVYFPVDGEPFSMAWGNVFEKADAIITYSDWAIDVIRDKFPELNKPIYKLYHGVNKKEFCRLPAKQIDKIRKKYSWEDKFVAVNINRFQPRKFIPGTARAYSMFAKGYKQCTSTACNHRMPIDRNRCELCREPVIKKGSAKNDVFLWLHMMPREPSMGPSRANLLQNHLLNAGFEDSDVGKILGVNARNIYAGDVPISEVNELYNAANVNVSSTLGEGCGLSLIEAASAGTPSIAPYNSAIPEMLLDTGWLVKNCGVVNMSMDNAHMRPVVDSGAMMDAFEEAYAEWKSNGKGKVPNKKCIANVDKYFLWDDKRTDLEDIFDKALTSIPTTSVEYKKATTSLTLPKGSPPTSPKFVVEEG